MTALKLSAQRLLGSVVLVALALTGCVPPPSETRDKPTPVGSGHRPGTGSGGSDSSVDPAGRSDGGAMGGGPGGQGSSDRDSGAGEPDPMGGTPSGAFPFPQDRTMPHCTHPDVDSTQVKSAWEKWKKEAVVSSGAGGFLRVRRWDQGDDTVSEGVAYGMIGAAYMNDQSTFDALWKYAVLHLNNNGFMHWRVDAGGGDIDENNNPVGVNGRSAASDADEDMAWAFIMAHYQWGGRGSLTTDYLQLAKDMIERIWRFEVDHNGGDVLKPGDRWGGASVTNPSYFAPAYYRVFGKIAGTEDAWNKVIESSYAILDRSANDNTGLVPAWCNASGGNVNMDYTYQYDACRTPFRIAFDYCLFGEPRALAYARKVGGFFKNIGAGSIKDGYDLDGNVKSQNTSMAFIGPAGVAGMVGGDLTGLANDAYTELLVLGGKQKSEGYSYYNSSWGLLSLLMMSGNFLDYSSL